MLTSITAAGTFTFLRLVLLLLFADLPVPKFHFQLKKKKTREKFRRVSDMVDCVTALAQLYALLSYRARSFNQCLRVLSPNFIITYISESNFTETVLVVDSN